MPDRQRVGKEGEDRAAEYLLGLGYTIVTRRFHTYHGELDLIALDREVLVFVEVKTRLAPGYAPEDAIGERKISALRRAAQMYLQEYGEGRESRFDVIAIEPGELRHHLGAI